MNGLPEFNRGNGVPPPKKDLHWVETVDAGMKIRFRVWSPAIWEVWTHFTGRTKPCFKNHKLCEHGHDESTLRWYGYVFGWHEQRNSKAFMQLTEGAARLWFNQIATGISLRGMVIDLTRGKSKKGPQLLNVVKYVNSEQASMGQDCDPQLSLYRLWKVNHLGHVQKLSLVTCPEELPLTPETEMCLKTPVSALSLKDPASASRTKKRSVKLNGKPNHA